MNDIENAYLAGIIDGEGCILISKAKKYGKFRSPHYFLRVMLQMSELPPMQYISERFGKEYKTRKLPGNRKDAYYIYWNSKFAEEILNKILPFLHGKKEQAVCAIEFRTATKRHRSGKTLTEDEVALREFYYRKLQSFKH